MSVQTDDSADTVQHARATVRPDKAATVAELAEAFRGSSAAVLTEYRGLTVKQISELRTALGADTSYAVVKNTLTKIAASDAGIDGLAELLSGPTAVAFVQGEPVEAAKALRDFAKAHPALVVKGGVMDGRTLTVDEIRKLADLESREVLLGKMAGALLASLSNAVYLLNAPLAQAARLAGALQAKATEDPSVIGGAGTAAPDLVEAALEAEESAADSTDAAADSDSATENDSTTLSDTTA
jgi:large subunit ribosomal protein L10